MLRKAIHSLLLRRHFWRHASFSEIAELYTSRMLRMAALHIAGAFMSIYLYQIGYSIVQIAIFWAAFYAFKAVVALPSAALTARIGPKHAILASNLLYIPAMVGFAALPFFGPWLFIPILILEGLSATLYSIAYNIDFSKVKSIEHAGKEIAYMNIVEKVTSGLSPLIGGVIAFLFGPQVVLVLAAVLFALAAVPLLRTAEPIPTHQKLQLRGFPWRLLKRHAAAQFALGFDVFSSGTVWMLFAAIIVIGLTESNDIYIASGIILSVVLFSALISSYVYGRLIDKSKGNDLMHFSVFFNAITHLVRPFVGTPLMVAAINVSNEAATTGYTMPYTRAIFDNADLSGQRTTYVGLIEILSNLGACVAAIALAIIAYGFGETNAITNFFFISAGVVLLILTARFPLYKRR